MQMRDFPMSDTDFSVPGNFLIDGHMLVMTCEMCPEQYDVYKGGRQVGYLRLRHGAFRADAHDCGGPEVYTAEPEGDGCFEPNEREPYLTAAIKAIKDYRP